MPAKKFDLLVLQIKPNQEQTTSPWAWHCWTPGLVWHFRRVFLSSWPAPSRFPFFLRNFLFCSTISRSKMFPCSSVGDGEELAGLTAAIAIFYNTRSGTYTPSVVCRILITCFCKHWLLYGECFPDNWKLYYIKLGDNPKITVEIIPVVCIDQIKCLNFMLLLQRHPHNNNHS